MIAKGNPHNNGAKLASYLITGKRGERAELWELRGFASDNIEDAFRSVHVIAEATKAEQPFFHVQVRNPTGEEVTRDVWEQIAKRIESKLGLTGQPRAIAFHIEEANGHEHMHIAWSRIDEETLTAKHMPFYKTRLKEVSRELEIKFGLTQVPNERESAIKYAPTRDEDEQARRLGVNIHDARQTIRNCYEQSDCGASFQAALEHEGLILAQGDRRGFVVIDHAGGIHALGKRILDVSVSAIGERLSDLARDELPTVEQARAYIPENEQARNKRLRQEIAAIDELIAAVQREQQQENDADQKRRLAEMDKTIAGALYERWKQDPARFDSQWNPVMRECPGVTAEFEKLATADAEREYAMRDPVREDMAWHDAVAQAAIEKEKIDRRFVEPKPGKEYRAGSREKEAAAERKPPAPELGKTQGQIRLARSLSAGPQSFANAIEDRGFILARVTAEDIQREMEKLLKEWEERRRNPRSWMEHEGGFAVLSPELQTSARRSFDEWEKQKDDGNARNGGAGTERKSTEQEQQQKLENYVDYVQKKWLEGPNSQLERAIGELAVVTPFGSIYTLTPRNTGLDRDELPRYLKAIDRAALLSVTDAQAVMEEVREHRREDWFARQPLGRTAGEIRLAYSLTQTGQEFANAIEDRGSILAFVTGEDAERLNRLEWRRLKEQWKAHTNETGNARKATGRGPQEPDKYRAGELVVVNQYGQVFQLNRHNTGHDEVARAEHLKDIDLTALMNVNDAQAVMREVQEHRREDWFARQPLGRTAGEIRLAYSLTPSGQEFANAIEDRGSILAFVTVADAERLNRWERQRLKEQWKAPATEKPGNARKTGERVPQEPDKYRAGELVVVNQYGQIFQLNRHNTGHDDIARAEHLKDIDRASLLSVTTAQGVMKEFQQHRQEERRQAWQQQREEWLKPAREEHWPTNAPQPERKAPGLFQQAASEAGSDGRTANLNGVAAQVFAAWRSSIPDYQPSITRAVEAQLAGRPYADLQAETMRRRQNAAWQRREGLRIEPDQKAFATALDDKGILFAVATKEEANRSHKQAAFARETGNYAPRFKEGEIVLVTEPRPEYRLDGQIAEQRRLYKLDQSLAEKFVKTLGNRGELKGIEATLKASDERAQQRAADWYSIRLENATNLKNQTAIAAADLKKGVHKSAYVAGNVLGGLGKGFHALSNAFDSLISPKLSPEQIYEGEKAKITREAEAEHSIDFSRYTADRAHERQNHQEQQAARDRQREIERDR
jgi:hypothetical protein